MKSFLSYFPNINLRKPHSIYLSNNENKITYSEFEKKVNTKAVFLKGKGIKEKDNVPLIFENNYEFIFTVFALWMLKAVPIPINIRLTNKEIENIISFTDSKYVLIDRNIKNKFNISHQRLISLPDREKSNKKIINEKLNLNDIAVIIFTSGSTGKPKGAMLSFNNLFQSALIGNQFLNITPKDKLLASLPFYHVGGFSILIRAFLFGATVIIPESLKIEDIIISIKKQKPTHASFVSTQLQNLIEEKINPNKELKNVLLGGGFISSELINSALKKKWKISKSYGSTETSSFVTAMNYKELKSKPNASGKALFPNKISIVDKDQDKLKENKTGEICVESSAIMKGYFKNKKETKIKLNKNLLFTGDIGFIDEEGFLFVEARRNDLIISGGENINPLEIEMEILKHNSVKEVCVFGLSDDKWGQIVCAAIVTINNEVINQNELKYFLKDKLAGYKIPKKIFSLEKLPRTELGKVQKEKIKKMFS